MNLYLGARAREARKAPSYTTISSLFILAIAGAVVDTAACSSFSSSGNGKDAAAGSGGSTPSGGNGGTSTGTGAGGAGGVGGAGGMSDGGSDGGAVTDGPPCIPDAGDAGACCPDGTHAGVCGCGTPDIDTDHDGVLDCMDACPDDPGKRDPGACGCFIAETDTDNDRTPDCIDRCPKDPDRAQPGPCGCGVADNTPLCLAHRYMFNDGAGAIIADSVGDADGTAVGFTPAGTGSVTLAGIQTDQYVRLPAGILSSLGNSATIEAWVSWTGNGLFWQRIFDFGSSNGGPGLQGAMGVSWLFLTPQGGAAPGTVLVSMVTPDGGLSEAPGTGLLPANRMVHVAVVVDNSAANADGGGGRALSLYVDGALVTQSAPNLPNPLSSLDDTNNCLGRSQFMADPELSGTYYEFRIYSAPRTADQIMASFLRGPEDLPLQ